MVTSESLLCCCGIWRLWKELSMRFFSEFQNQKNLWFQVLENVQRTDSSGERTSKGSVVKGRFLTWFLKFLELWLTVGIDSMIFEDLWSRVSCF
jgi:hypothetical protein